MVSNGNGGISIGNLVLLNKDISLPKFKNENESDMVQCGVCFDDFSNISMVNLPCSHTMCFDCMRRWLVRKSTCPFCRVDFRSAESQELDIEDDIDSVVAEFQEFVLDEEEVGIDYDDSSDYEP